MSHTASPLDLHDPSLPGRLHRAFDDLRRQEPVHAIADGRWLLTRYDDVAEFLKDRTRCSTDIHAVRGYDELRPFGAGSDLERVQEGLLINLPDAEHRRVRGAFTRPFTRASVESSLTRFVEGLVDDLFGALPDDGVVDWVAAVARPMPAQVFQFLFALPEAQLEWLLELLHQDTVAIDVLLSPDLVSPADLAVATAAFLDLRREIDRLANERHGGDGEDLLTFLLEQYDAGVLTWDDVLTQAMEALAAGTSTTSTLLTGMVEGFATHPEQWELLRADRSLIRPAVEEALRWVSPALSMGRVATVDFELHGVTIRAGDVIQCGVLPANRDPAVFDDPHAFDITRSSRPRPDGKKGAPGQAGAAHVAFGGGTHTCLGAHVARLEARIVLERLVERYARLELEPGAAVLHPTLLIRTYASMPLRLRST
ncbi:MAG: cytochrome P450 [Solirubrobacteraceae bacterium]|nr:cytochrome P450 [Solirubrobacteraceae bacterium]